MYCNIHIYSYVRVIYIHRDTLYGKTKLGKSLQDKLASSLCKFWGPAFPSSLPKEKGQWWKLRTKLFAVYGFIWKLWQLKPSLGLKEYRECCIMLCVCGTSFIWFQGFSSTVTVIPWPVVVKQHILEGLGVGAGPTVTEKQRDLRFPNCFQWPIISAPSTESPNTFQWWHRLWIKSWNTWVFWGMFTQQTISP